MYPNEVFALECRRRYAEDGLIVDKSNGEFAHCPLPKGLGETGYYLLHDDHQWHGLLQSRDVGRKCYWTAHVYKWLMSANFVEGYFDLWDTYDEFNKQTDEQRRKIGEKHTGEKNCNFGKYSELHHNSIAISATNLEGTELCYGSISEAARELKFQRSAIQRYLTSGRLVTKGKFKGWGFKYV
jgi:hypothetical protein